MSWLWVLGAWLWIGAVLGVLIGRGVAIADRKQRESAAAEAPNFAVDPAVPPIAIHGIPEPAAAPDAENTSPPRKYGDL